MGGNAIKDARRIDRTEMVQICYELQDLFPELKMKPIRAYRQKPDFGDIDIVIETQPHLSIKDLVRKRLNPPTEYDNNQFYSFEYKGVQVDFIQMSPQTFLSSLAYFGWNDLGNFIGRIARSLNFKYGHDGLSYELHLADHYKLNVHVSSDTNEILEFLGYDPEQWNKGFDTKEEIFAYAASSKYFNALYFSLEEQGHVDRIRNKKRKMYQDMLTYIENNGIEPKPKLTQEERQVHYDRAVERFGNYFDEEVKASKQRYDISRKAKEFYNGDLVSKATGLTGKELGVLMRKIAGHCSSMALFVSYGGFGVTGEFAKEYTADEYILSLGNNAVEQLLQEIKYKDKK